MHHLTHNPVQPVEGHASYGLDGLLCWLSTDLVTPLFAQECFLHMNTASHSIAVDDYVRLVSGVPRYSSRGKKTR